MKVSRKLLSILLAAVMLISSVPVLSMAVKPYKDAAITKYDDADKPIFTVDQNASMLLDYLDKTLSASAVPPTEIPIVNVRLDLSSVNGLLNTLVGLQSFKDGFWGGFAKWLIGDIMTFDFTMIKGVQRGTTDDLTIIYKVIQLISTDANWNLIEKFVTAQLDLGLLGSFAGNEINAVLAELDVTFIFKALMYAIAYPQEDSIPDKQHFDKTVDQMVQDGTLTLMELILGKDTTKLFRDAEAFDINNPYSTYDFVYGLIAVIYDNLIVPAFNQQLKDMVRGACGIDTTVYPHNIKVPDEIAQGSIYAAVIDVNFEAPKLDLAEGDIVSTINDNLGALFEAVLKDYTAWNYGDNTKILENITAALKHAWIVTDGKIIPSANGYTPKTRDEVEGMTSQQVLAYVLRSLLNTYDPATIMPGQESMLSNFLRDLPTVYIPDDATNITRVLWYTSQQLSNHYLPKQNYATLAMSKNKDDVQSVMNILADLIAYGLNKSIDFNVAAKTSGAKPQDNAGLLPYGVGFDKTLTFLMQKLNVMVLPMFTQKFTIDVNDPMSGWKALDALAFSMINKNWLPTDVTNKPYIMKELIQNRLLKDVCDLNLNRMLDLVDKNKNTSSDLYLHAIKKNLFLVMQNAINSIFPDALSDRTSPQRGSKIYLQCDNIFDEMMDNFNLMPMLHNIVLGLDKRKTTLMKTVLPLLVQMMSLSAPQALGSMTVSMPQRIKGATTFTIRNNSTGVNTGYTNSAGKFTQDKLYTYVVTNYRVYQNGQNGTYTENKNITIAGLAKGKTADTGVVINGGNVLNAKLQGSFPVNTQDLNLRIELDYLIKDEVGKVISSTPLTARVNTFYTNEDRDESKLYYVAGTAGTVSTNLTGTQKRAKYTIGAPYAYFREWREPLSGLRTTLDIQVKRNSSYLPIPGMGNETVKADIVTMQNAETKSLIQSNDLSAPLTVSDTDVIVALYPFLVYQRKKVVMDENNKPKTVNDPILTSEIPLNKGLPLDYSVTTAAGTLSTINGTIKEKPVLISYKDFDLPALYLKEVTLNRQAGDYSDSTKWNNYLKAMASTAYLVQRPKRLSDFISKATHASYGYEGNKKALDAAIKALDGVKKTNDNLSNLKKKLDAYNYKKQTVAYDDAKYIYDGEVDFVPYTYNNYAVAMTRGNEVYAAASLSGASYDAPTLLNTTKYIDLMRGRRIRVTSTDARLKEALALCQGDIYTEDFYTAESWAVYKKALNFTNATLKSFNATTTPSSKLNEARFQLLKAWKNLEFSPKKDIYVVYFEHRDADHLVTSTAVRAMQGKPIPSDKIPANPSSKSHKFIGWTAEIPGTMPGNDIFIKSTYESKKLDSIEVTSSPAYLLKGQALDASKIVFTAKYNNGPVGNETGKKGNATGVTVSGYDKTKTGTQTITVKWQRNSSESKSTTFKLPVYAKVPSSIKVTTPPTKVTYGAGQNPVYTGGKITVTYSDKSTAVVNMTDSRIKYSGYTATKVGTQTLTATFTENTVAKTATFPVKVLAAPTKLTMSRSSATIGVKEGVTLTATPTPAAAATFLTWSSSDKSVATVSSAGKVTGVKAGSTTITATAYNKVKITCKVTVKAAPGSVKTNVATRTLGKGETYQLTAVCPANTASFTNTWKSSNTKIATVDKNGLVKGVANGKATITLTTFNKKTATCTITVKAAPASVTLNVASRTLGIGEAYKLVSTLPKDTASKLTWTSANTKIATVDGSGNVKGVAAGSAKITVKTFNGKSATCTVTVKKAPGSVSLNTKSVTLGATETFQLSVTLPKDTASNKRTWSSSKPSVAKVDANGKVTAVAPGTATITVKLFNGKTATCTVTVKKAPTGVKLNVATKSMTKGTAYQLSILLPANTASNKRTWSSSNTKVATVNAAGKVTAVAKGTATITVKTYNGKTTTCKITVK